MHFPDAVNAAIPIDEGPDPQELDQGKKKTVFPFRRGGMERGIGFTGFCSSRSRRRVLGGKVKKILEFDVNTA